MEEQTSEKKDFVKKERYDKSAILEIVKDVEKGIARRLIIEKYRLGKSTLTTWMKVYGSESYHQNKRKVYSKFEKSTIVAAIEQGRMTVNEACKAYQIVSAKSIRDWRAQSIREKGIFSLPIKVDMAKRKKTSYVKDVSDSDLYKALQEAQLKIIALNTLIEVAEEQLKIDIRKKSGAKPLSE
jgi:transposase